VGQRRGGGLVASGGEGENPVAYSNYTVKRTRVYFWYQYRVSQCPASRTVFPSRVLITRQINSKVHIVTNDIRNLLGMLYRLLKLLNLWELTAHGRCLVIQPELPPKRCFDFSVFQLDARSLEAALQVHTDGARVREPE